MTRLRERAARPALAAGERKAASRDGLLSERVADAHRSIEPESGKAGFGEQRAYVTPLPNATFWPCMPAGEQAVSKVTWNHFSFSAPLFRTSAHKISSNPDMRSSRFFVAGALAGGLALGQAGGARQEFDVSSIRPSQPSGQQRVDVGLHLDGSQVRISSLDLASYVAMAYRLKRYQVTGPDWLTSTRFDINAKLPAGSTSDNIPEMLQSLLASQFGLRFHREKNDLPVYAIIVGKPPLKLEESAPDPNDAPAPKATNIAGSGSAEGVAVNFGNGSYYTFADNKFIIKKVSMDRMVTILERYVDRPMLDSTGLKGTYDLTFPVTPEDYQTMLIRAGANTGIVLPPVVLQLLDNASIGSLSDGLEKVGLKLDSRKSPIDMLVVDQMLKTPKDN